MCGKNIAVHVSSFYYVIKQVGGHLVYKSVHVQVKSVCIIFSFVLFFGLYLKKEYTRECWYFFTNGPPYKPSLLFQELGPLLCL